MVVEHGPGQEVLTNGLDHIRLSGRVVGIIPEIHQLTWVLIEIV